MKKTGYLLALSAFSGMLAASSAFAAGKSVVVVNQTPFTLNEFYASASYYQGDWLTGSTYNLINGAPVGPGGQTTITINDGQMACHYDLMGVLDGQSNHAYQYRVDACDGNTWTITSSGS